MRDFRDEINERGRHTEMSTMLDERPGINTWCMGHTSIYFVYGYFYSWNNITSLESFHRSGC